MSHNTIPKKVIERCLSANNPTYVYDFSTLRATVSSIQSSFKDLDAVVLFATMANPRAEVLEILSSLGVGACVNSVAHLRAAIRAGMLREHIHFTSSGLSIDDLKEVAFTEIQCNVDSMSQAATLMSFGSGVACGARINTRRLLAERVSVHDRLGVDPVDLHALRSLIETRGGRLNGLHIYVGTNFRSHVDMLPAIDSFFYLAEKVSTLEYVNVGGGIGIDYTRLNEEFNINEYAIHLKKNIDKLSARLGRRVQLIVEPGRAITASSGYFTCKVTDIKKLGDRIFIGVNASVAQFPRPWHHPETPHKIYAVKPCGDSMPEDDATSLEAVIAGRTTYSKDVLSMGRLPSNVQIGDVLIFADAGAYCDSMASRFLGQPEPESVFLD